MSRFALFAVILLVHTAGVTRAAPTYQVIANAEVVWEKPTSPKGVLFAAHGCNHAAVDWWPQSSECPKCIGLPEEVNITQRALARGFALVAISSFDRTGSRCWHPVHTDGEILQHTKDTEQVSSALQQLLAEQQMGSLPVYALGASSGGAFVLALPFHMKLAGVCSQISSFPTGLFRKMLAAKMEMDPSFKYPPTVFVHMPRDEYTAAHVFHLRQFLEHHEVKNKEIEVLPRVIDSAFLMHKLQIREHKASKIVQALRAAEVLNNEGFPKADPRMVEWRQELSKFPELENIPTAADVSALPEVLNLAFAGHEIISDTTDEVLAWWEGLAAHGLLMD